MTRQWSKRFVVIVAILLLAGACAAPPASSPTPVPPTATPVPLTPTAVPPTPTTLSSTPASSSDLEKLAMAFQDAFNQRDLDAVLALFVDDGLNYMWIGQKTSNKTDVRSGLEYMIGQGATFTIADCSPKGKALACTLELRDDYCAEAWSGLDVWRHDLTLSAQDNKIRLFSAMRTDEYAKALFENYPKLRDWAEANRPDDWKKWNAAVAYDLSGRPLGELESQICKAYLEATKQ